MSSGRTRRRPGPIARPQARLLKESSVGPAAPSPARKPGSERARDAGTAADNGRAGALRRPPAPTRQPSASRGAEERARRGRRRARQRGSTRRARRTARGARGRHGRCSTAVRPDTRERRRTPPRRRLGFGVRRLRHARTAGAPEDAGYHRGAGKRNLTGLRPSSTFRNREGVWSLHCCRTLRATRGLPFAAK